MKTRVLALILVLPGLCLAQPDTAFLDAARGNHTTFKCIAEKDTLPPLSAESELLFRYGQLKRRALRLGASRADVDLVARYYRVAAAYGHYYAANELIDLLRDFEPNDSVAEVNAVIDNLVNNDISIGYLLKGSEAEFAKKNKVEAAFYYRKAAERGNALAKISAGDNLNRYITPGEIAGATDDDTEQSLLMYQCAEKEGENSAFRREGSLLLLHKGQPEQALLTWQRGVNAGDPSSTTILAHLFSGWSWTDVVGTYPQSLRAQQLSVDPERARRYAIFKDYLETYGGYNVMPDVNKIIPLPPEPLPEWDEVISEEINPDYIRNFSLPNNDALLEKMALDKGLSTTTGLLKN